MPAHRARCRISGRRVLPTLARSVLPRGRGAPALADALSLRSAASGPAVPRARARLGLDRVDEPVPSAACARTRGPPPRTRGRRGGRRRLARHVDQRRHLVSERAAGWAGAGLVCIGDGARAARARCLPSTARFGHEPQGAAGQGGRLFALRPDLSQRRPALALSRSPRQPHLLRVYSNGDRGFRAAARSVEARMLLRRPFRAGSPAVARWRRGTA